MQHQRVVDQLIAMFGGDFTLALFNSRIMELDHGAGLETNHMVVMVIGR